MATFKSLSPKTGAPCVGTSTPSFCNGKCRVAATNRAYIMYVAERAGFFTLVNSPVKNYKEGSIKVLSSTSRPGVLCLQHVHSAGVTIIGFVQPIKDGILFTAGDNLTAEPVRISFNFKSYCRLRRRNKDGVKKDLQKAPIVAKKDRKPKKVAASVVMQADLNVQSA